MLRRNKGRRRGRPGRCDEEDVKLCRAIDVLLHSRLLSLLTGTDTSLRERMTEHKCLKRERSRLPNLSSGRRFPRCLLDDELILASTPI
jgi:hypothetical protein